MEVLGKGMSVKRGRSPKVFISYSYDSDSHKERVLNLADRLRADGIDCHIDRYEMSPREGWPNWMASHIEDSDFVLLVCTETYATRFNGRGGRSSGLGVTWEGAIITQNIYETARNDDKFIPVIFSQDDSKFRPTVLRAVTYYNVGTEDGYEDLLRRLTNQPPFPKPELGEIKTLPPRRRNQTAVNARSNDRPSSKRSAIGKKVDQNDYESLALVMNRQRKYHLIPSARIESDTVTRLHLTPVNPHQIAFLSSLKDSFDKSVAVAFGLNALEARIENASQLREAGREVWTVTLQPEKEGHDNGIFEFSMNGWSADDIAELRARRILLNEQVGGARFSAMDRLNAGLIEHNVRGENRYVGEARSPFPELYTELGNDLPYFLASARLFAVLYLRLTGTVRHVLKLDLALRDVANLDVRFEGQRPQVYANKEPRVIKVKGSCPLIGSYDDDDV
jgi:hypothetical protein